LKGKEIRAGPHRVPLFLCLEEKIHGSGDDEERKVQAGGNHEIMEKEATDLDPPFHHVTG
jgi:hypothetical protein